MMRIRREPDPVQTDRPMADRAETLSGSTVPWLCGPHGRSHSRASSRRKTRDRGRGCNVIPESKEAGVPRHIDTLTEEMITLTNLPALQNDPIDRTAGATRSALTCLLIGRSFMGRDYG